MLRNPEFGNIFRLHRDITVQHTVDREVRSFSKAQNHESFSVTIKALTRTDVDRFRQYLTSTYGEIIRIRDHELRFWEGLVTSDELRIIGKDDCNLQLSFDFEGVVLG